MANGLLVRVERGLYAVAGSEDTWLRRTMGAVLLSGPGSLAGARAAAGLWQLHRFRRSHIDVVTSRWERPTRRRGWSVQESLVLPSRDRTVLEGIPVTTPTRTLFDVARHVSVRRLGSMVDDAVVRDLTSYEDLHRRFAELATRGRNGIANLREVLEMRPSGAVAPDSTFERDVRNQLRSVGLEPVLHHRVDAGEIEYVLDVAWPGHLVAVECDGFRFHRTEEQLEWDDQRRNTLTLLGWIVLHETFARFRRDPTAIVREALGALRARGAPI